LQFIKDIAIIIVEINQIKGIKYYDKVKNEKTHYSQNHVKTWRKISDRTRNR
jgi:hypothetical protein